MTLANVPHRELRVAFYGRAAFDADDTAMPSIARQYEQCRRVLPPGAITAIFYDIGSYPTFRRPPGSLPVGDQTMRRDGGLDTLLFEAARAPRRFDQLITYSPDRLSRDTGTAYDLMHRLQRAGVQHLFPIGDVAPSGPGTYWRLFMHLVAETWTEAWRRAAEDGDPQ